MSEQSFESEHGRHQKFSISCNNTNYFASCWFYCDLFSAVMLQPLAWADTFCLSWLFICRAFLSFFLVFSLFLGSVLAPRIVLFPLPLQGVSWKGRVSWNGDKFLGSKRCCCCSQLLCRCRDHPLLLPLVLSLESKNPSQEVKELLKEWAVGDSGSEADCFYLRDRKRSLVPLLLMKAHKETSTLTVSLPGKLAGVFH